MGKSSRFLGVTLFKPTGKWRAQISMGGTTTSLGDHDTEEDAARAFDRAALNRSGTQAKTNFGIVEYATELDQLTSMEQSELVQMLRSRARKSGTHTSNYRGVSLLRHTQKWHAQINVNGRQVHLGFYESEELAARAYDRAAINKGAREHSRIITNFDINDYAKEISILAAMEQHELVDILAVEQARNKFIPVLQQGSATHVAMMLSRPDFSACPMEQVDKFKGSASRAVPKLQHLPRWGLPQTGLPSPLGNNSARSTIINTARSVVINGGAVGHEWPQADENRNQIAGKAHDATPLDRDDIRNGADSGLDGVRTWDSDSLKRNAPQAAYEMTPRDTANSTVCAAGGEAADFGQMQTRSKRLCNTASESLFRKGEMRHSYAEEAMQSTFLGRGAVQFFKQESCMPAQTTTTSGSRRSMNRRTRRAPQRAAV